MTPDRPKGRPEPKDWEHQIAQQVGESIEYYRGKRDLTAAQLAELVWPGSPPGRRMVIVNLENGKREAVSVAEVLAIAAALRVPPLVLVLPVGREGVTLLGPDSAAVTPLAVQWFVGDLSEPNGLSKPARDELGQDELTDAIGYANRYRQVVQLHRGVEALRVLAHSAEGSSAEEQMLAELPDRQRSLEAALQALRDMRTIMRAKGQAVPPLPDYLAHLDDDEERGAH